jgi:hypothetical protein
MLYGIIAVFNHISFFNDVVSDADCGQRPTLTPVQPSSTR